MTILFILYTTTAMADVQLQSFNWKADNSVNAVFESNGVAKAFKGTVRDGETVVLSGDAATVTVNALSSSFVALSAVESGAEFGQLLVLERQNADYVPMAPAIRGRAASLATDFHGALESLRKTNRWDHSIALRALVSYFKENPGKIMGDFYDAVELGHIRAMAKPAPKQESQVPSRRRQSAARPTVTEAPPASAPGPATRPPRRQKEDPVPRKRETVRREVRQPEGVIPPPRMSAPRNDYPGQAIRRRAERERSRQTEPRRRSRGFFESLFGN